MMYVHKVALSLTYYHLDVPNSCHTAVCQQIIAVAMFTKVVAVTPAVKNTHMGVLGTQWPS